MGEAADWLDLNSDLVKRIGESIDDYSDYFRFSTVCFAWRSSLPDNPKQFPCVPCLLVPPPPSLAESPTVPTTPSACLLNPLIPDVRQLPLLTDAVFIVGSSKGWLIAADKKGPSIFLINPFTTHHTQTQIHHLPPIHTFPAILDYQPHRVDEELLVSKCAYPEGVTMSFEEVSSNLICKVALSSSLPNTKDFAAVAIFRDAMELAFCRHGDTKWSLVPDCLFIQDIIFHKDKCYAADSLGQILMISDLDSSPKAVSIINPPTPARDIIGFYLYLVESPYNSDLLMISRHILWPNNNRHGIHNTLAARNFQWRNDDDDHTVNFEIFKLNLESSSSNNTKMRISTDIHLNSLCDQVMFLGLNESISLPSRNFYGCKGNHIYFSDQLEGADVGVFDYNQRNLYPLPGYTHHLQDPLLFPLIWVMRHNS